jgi:putative peptidoglycan lipid II flippase
VLTIALGLVFALVLPGWLGIDRRWGVAGLTASAGIAGWVEFTLLRGALGRRIGRTPLPKEFTAALWAVAFVAALAAYGVKLLIGTAHPLLVASIVLPVYGAIYFGGTAVLGIAESQSTLRAIARRLRRA